MSICRAEAAALREFAWEALRRVGCSAEDAQKSASVLHWASLRGVDTHGFRNLVPYYVNEIRGGPINPAARCVVEHETDSTARINGNSGLGLVNATDGMQLAIEKAGKNGNGMVVIHNSHHLGPAGYYAHLALDKGMLGICATGHFFGKGHDIGVAPINGAMPMFSTNPFAFAAPCGDEPPFLLDMSTAVATVNRIEREAQRGQSIPMGWAKDSAGKPTSDPDLARVLYPLGGQLQTGGHKGIGLAMMISILSGVLSGGWSRMVDSDEFDQSTMGHFLAAIRIDQFMPTDRFVDAMDAFLKSIGSSPRIDASQAIHYPGSQEHAIAEERRKNGIPITARLRQEYLDLAISLSMDTSLFD